MARGRPPGAVSAIRDGAGDRHVGTRAVRAAVDAYARPVAIAGARRGGDEAVPRQTEVFGRYRSHVHETGEGADQAAVFLHGSGPGATALSNWRLALSAGAADRHCVTMDFIGFGRSEHPADPPGDISGWVDLWVEQVLEVMDHAGIRRAHVIGNSMGGAVAMHLLARHPERVDLAVLMGAVGAPFEMTPALDLGWGYYDDPSPQRMEELMRAFVYDTDVIGGDLREIAEERSGAALDPNVRRSFEAMFPPDRQRHIDALALTPEQLGRISHPVLLMHGRDDEIVPPQTSHYFLEHLPAAQLHLFGKCRHWVQIEQPDAFHALVSAFLDGEL